MQKFQTIFKRKKKMHTFQKIYFKKNKQLEIEREK